MVILMLYFFPVSISQWSPDLVWTQA